MHKAKSHLLVQINSAIFDQFCDCHHGQWFADAGYSGDCLWGHSLIILNVREANT